MQPTATPQGRNSLSAPTTTPSGSTQSTSPMRVLNFFAKWTGNQTSLAEVVWPLCLTCLGQHSGAVQPDTAYSSSRFQNDFALVPVSRS